MAKYWKIIQPTGHTDYIVLFLMCDCGNLSLYVLREEESKIEQEGAYTFSMEWKPKVCQFNFILGFTTRNKICHCPTTDGATTSALSQNGKALNKIPIRK